MSKDKKRPIQNHNKVVRKSTDSSQKSANLKNRRTLDDIFISFKDQPGKRVWYLLYAYCYYIGNETVRLFEKTIIFIQEFAFFLWRYILLDSVRAAIKWLKSVTIDSFRHQNQEHKRWLEEKIKELKAIESDIAENEAAQAAQPGLKPYDKSGSLRLYETITKEIALKKRKTAVARVMPIVSLAFLLFVLFTVTRFDVALQVTYAGKSLGYIANEQVYDAAISDIEDRIMGVSTRYNFNETPNYKIAYVPKSEVQTDASKFSDTFLKAAMGEEVNSACGVYVNDEFIFAVSDQNQIQTYVKSLLKPYQQRNPTGDISFYDTVTFKTGMYPTVKVVGFDKASSLLSSTTVTTRQYTMAKVDTIATISAKLGVSAANFTQYNPSVVPTSIAPGTVVTVKVPRAFLRVKETVKTKYNVTIPFTTVVKNNSNQPQGWSTVTTKGSNGLKTVSVNLYYVDGVNVGQDITSTVVVQNPVNQVKQVGTLTGQKTAKAVNFNGVTVTGKFMDPVPDGYLSCGWMGYPGHNGDDLAAPYGTNIYAADGGVVVGVYYWGYSYGLHVVIDHGNGYETTYNHMSKIRVTVGQKVDKGQLIGNVGETGHAYGCHCHFEIRINGECVNPTPYIFAGKSAK